MTSELDKLTKKLSEYVDNNNTPANVTLLRKQLEYIDKLKEADDMYSLCIVTKNCKAKGHASFFYADAVVNNINCFVKGDRARGDSRKAAAIAKALNSSRMYERTRLILHKFMINNQEHSLYTESYLITQSGLQLPVFNMDWFNPDSIATLFRNIGWKINIVSAFDEKITVYQFSKP